MLSSNVRPNLAADFKAMKLNERSLAYALLRIAIGVNYAGHGMMRFYTGLRQFVAGTADHLAKSPLPHGFVVAFLYAVPFVEAAVGVALILGIATRTALVVTAVLMIFLMAGIATNQQWDTAGAQLVYDLILFVLLFLHDYDDLSLDAFLRRGR